MAFRIGNRTTNDHYLGDIISDILSGSKSARLYEKLVKELKLFTQINAYISSGFEHGLFMVTGFLQNEISFEMAEDAIWNELNLLSTNDVSEKELTKVRNKFKTAKAFQNQSIQNRVMNISQFAILDNLKELNKETALYEQISLSDIQAFSQTKFKRENVNVLSIKAENES